MKPDYMRNSNDQKSILFLLSTNYLYYISASKPIYTLKRNVEDMCIYHVPNNP